MRQGYAGFLSHRNGRGSRRLVIRSRGVGLAGEGRGVGCARALDGDMAALPDVAGDAGVRGEVADGQEELAPPEAHRDVTVRAVPAPVGAVRVGDVEAQDASARRVLARIAF